MLETGSKYDMLILLISFLLTCHSCIGILISIAVSVYYREGKYIPLPQRAREREMGGRGERGGAVSTLPNRTNRPGPSSSSPRPLPSGSTQSIHPSDRSSPLSVRGGYSTCSPPTQPRPNEPGHSSPPSPHTLPHSLSHPQSLSDAGRPVNGGKLFVYLRLCLCFVCLCVLLM